MAVCQQCGTTVLPGDALCPACESRLAAEVDAGSLSAVYPPSRTALTGAGFAPRTFAYMLDYLVIALVVLVGGQLAAMMNGYLIVPTLLLPWVYFIAFEGAFGATPGKFARGLRVVMEDRSRCTWKAAVVRNIVLGLLSWLGILGYAIIWISMSGNDARQHWGDRAGHTVVVFV